MHLERDRIAVDGRSIATASKIYLMLNKPRGVVTTASDEKDRPTVYSLLNQSRENAAAKNREADAYPAGALPWVGPAGRLDQASEGLLLLTNDSEWAARVTDPMSHLSKTYHVQVAATGVESLAAALAVGVRCEGELLRAKSAGVLRRGEKNAWLEIVLDEGKNRQIRRMFEQMGIEVLRLVRVAIGPLALGTLAKGQSRALTRAEKASVDQAMKQRLEARG